MTFEVGDKVVYPMHGAGIIEAIEEKEILGEKHKYYIMHLPIGDMRVMLPMANVKEIGLRPVIEREDVPEVIKLLRAEQTKMSVNWNRRYRANMEKMKTGDIREVAEVVRNLVIRDNEKGLSTGERKMLETAKQILVSELILVSGKTEEEVEAHLEEWLSQPSGEEES
ncbi:MAG: CarD family transcriptional regulator [Limnochordia bacterium]